MPRAPRIRERGITTLQLVAQRINYPAALGLLQIDERALRDELVHRQLEIVLVLAPRAIQRIILDHHRIHMVRIGHHKPYTHCGSLASSMIVRSMPKPFH